jgi:hypothetical protein
MGNDSLSAEGLLLITDYLLLIIDYSLLIIPVVLF